MVTINGKQFYEWSNTKLVNRDDNSSNVLLINIYSL